MSRDIALVCDDCQECLWVGECREGTPPVVYAQQPEAMRALATFLVQHQGHMLSSGGSHDYDGYAEIGWDVAFPAQELEVLHWIKVIGVGILALSWPFVAWWLVWIFGH